MSEAVGGWQEVTLRVWFDPTADANPEKWAWEEMLGTEVHVVNVEAVELLDHEGQPVGPRDEEPPEPSAEMLIGLNDWLTANFPGMTDEQLDEGAHKLGAYLVSIFGAS